MNMEMIKAILNEYGIRWAFSRGIYSSKIRLLRAFPYFEKIFEKKVSAPIRLDVFQLDIGELRFFLNQLPKNSKDRLIQNADDACHGRIMGFSSLKLDYGEPIDWQLNPITGCRCSEKVKWYDIADFDQERGDIKAIWEASRFLHFITFARAYLVTDNDKYYKVFSNQLKDWIKKNPYSYGANFKCGQECAIRMINAILAYTVFEKCHLATKADKKNVERIVLLSYKKILSNFFYAYRCIKNNHTISELVGMAIASWICGEGEVTKYSFDKLNEVIDAQFTDDGGYIQYSFNYERLALQDIEVILGVEQTLGYSITKSNKKKLLKAVYLMYQCQDESGDMPNYGANDGAVIFPVTSCGYRDFRPIIQTVYCQLTGKKAYPKGLYDEELLWFGNIKTNERDLGKLRRRSSRFHRAGLYTLRNSRSWMMIVLNEYHSRPAHMDQLHLDLWISGINVLCDGGTYSYASEQGKELLDNGSHNTVKYGQASQMNRYGSFMIYGWTKRKNVQFDGFTFSGEYISANGYGHRRKVLSTETGYLIQDYVKGKTGDKFVVCFHTPCDIEEIGKELVLSYKGKKMCSIIIETNYLIKSSVRSLYYMKMENTNCIALIGLIHDGCGNIKTIIKDKGE